MLCLVVLDIAQTSSNLRYLSSRASSLGILCRCGSWIYLRCNAGEPCNSAGTAWNPQKRRLRSVRDEVLQGEAGAKQPSCLSHFDCGFWSWTHVTCPFRSFPVLLAALLVDFWPYLLPWNQHAGFDVLILMCWDGLLSGSWKTRLVRRCRRLVHQWLVRSRASKTHHRRQWGKDESTWWNIFNSCIISVYVPYRFVH